MHYKCASCEAEFPMKKVQVDHKKPVVHPKDGFVDWDTFINRLYVEKSNLQVLCKPCHEVKSKSERAKRGKK